MYDADVHSDGPATVVRVPLTLVVLGLCATSVGALLADLYGLVDMATFGRFVTLPALVLLGVLGSSRASALGDVPQRIRVGAVAGLVGTLGYDVVRIPFALVGQRIFAPIDSYGLLLDDGPMSSGWTDFLGWAFHVSNGVTFGIAFVLVAARRHWGWGVLWGLVLESAAFASPFTERYDLTGKYGAIAIAYAAHVAYGLPLGRFSQRYDQVREWLGDLEVRRPVTVALVVVVGALALWHRPWSVPEAVERARQAELTSGTATAVVEVDRFQPEWLRADADGCVELISRSDRTFREPAGQLTPGGTARWCFDDPGVHRVRLGDRPYSGGFVVVDGP